MGNPAIDLLQRLVGFSETELEGWLQRIRSGQEVLPRRFELADMAEFATFRAQELPQDSQSGSDLAWTRLTIRLYEEIAAHDGEREKNRALGSAMRLRALMIERYGSLPGDYIRDQNRIVQWFFSSLPMTFEQASRRAEHWRDLPIEETRQLRDIKNRLSVIDSLLQTGLSPASGELRAWLDLRPSLP